MNWTPSSASSASSIQHYVVQVDDWWDHKAGLLTTVSTLNSDARQFTLSDPHKIIPGSSYQVRVGAVDNQDTASWSSVTTVKVDGIILVPLIVLHQTHLCSAVVQITVHVATLLIYCSSVIGSPA